MKTITNIGQLLQEIKSQTNIVTVARDFGANLKQTGKTYKGTCPAGHSSTSNQSFHVDPILQLFHCWNCGIGGDVFTLIQELEGLEIVESAEWLIDKYNLPLDASQLQNNSKPTPEQLKEREAKAKRYDLYANIVDIGKRKLYEDDEAKEALDYLIKGRGYSLELLKKTDWFYLPNIKKLTKELIRDYPEMNETIKDMPLKYGDTLALPYRNRKGRIIGFSMRNHKYVEGGSKGSKYYNTEGLSKDDLFGLNYVKKGTSSVIIVEGYADVEYARANDIKDVVAIGQGTFMDSYFNGLNKLDIKNVVLSYDNDAVKNKNKNNYDDKENLAKEFKPWIKKPMDDIKLILKKTSIIPYVIDPSEYKDVKDPDEYLVKYGKESLQRILKQQYEHGAVWIVKKLVEKYCDKEATKIRKSEIIDEIYELTQYVDDDVIIKEIHELFSKDIIKQSMAEFRKKVKSKCNIDDQTRDAITKKAFVPFVDTFSATLCYYDKKNDRLKMKADDKILKNILLDNKIKVPIVYPTYEVKFNPCEIGERFDQLNKTFNLFTPTEYMLMESNDDKIDLEVACPRIFTLLRNLIPVESEREKFINWLSYIFVNLVKVDVSWVFRGDQGSGKNLFFKSIIKPLFGKNQTSVVDDDRLQSDFNSYIKNKLFIVFNEVANDETKTRRSVKSKIKAIVSDTEIQLHQKFLDAYEMENYANLLFFSNEVLPLLVEQRDRRFNIIETGGQLKQLPSFKRNPKEFIGEIGKELKQFAQYLHNYKYDELTVNEVIENDAKARIKELSMNKYELFASKLKANDWEWFEQFYPVPTKHNDVKWINSNYMTEEELKSKKVEQGKVLRTFGNCNDRYSADQGTLTKQLKINSIRKFRERHETSSTYYYVWD